ncbi:hypothetical protein CKAN_02544700 [Cinnamomum micranthum f. kanehirae]|uniref:Uncharacterized protein n=1 Tax=Cinnamomum micranthum f. kanehirae TaxID=337451 RepID=A0A3S3NIZ6_9MAGN|nr:hypothetical protein CKAN_02544700 [Cinnamomum micranthum f. kanehirae]
MEEFFEAVACWRENGRCVHLSSSISAPGRDQYHQLGRNRLGHALARISSATTSYLLPRPGFPTDLHPIWSLLGEAPSRHISWAPVSSPSPRLRANSITGSRLAR